MYIYNSLPVFIQNLLVSSYGFVNDRKRYGVAFYEALDKLQSQDLYPPEEMKALQSKALRQFLKHANKSVFWQKRFKKYSVDLAGDPVAELKKLPVLTKQEVRDNAKDIVIAIAKLRSRSTSGSTGAGLSFYGNEYSEAVQWAVWWRYWSRFGIQRGKWCAHFGGKTVVPVDNKKPPYYRVNFASKQVMFSAYHLSENTVPFYIEMLNKKKVQWLHGYASVISELARLALKANLKLNYRVTFISLGSENVTRTHERVIYEFFGIKPIQHYGLAEGVANFSNKPGEEGLFVDEDFAFVEFLPVGDQFKIVGTNFTNYAFPLIRYDTSDLASNVDQTVFPRHVGSIDGRQDDFIVLPTGERVGRVASVFNEFDFIDESQLVQKSNDAILVNIVRNSRWNSGSELLVRHALHEKLGRDININFQYVEAVRRTASGKVRFVISEV